MLSTCLFTLSLFAAAGFSKPILDPNSSPSNESCPTNNFHKVTAGDTCQSIAAIASVSTGDLQALNSLNAQCTDLKANSTICLPGPCTTYLVKAGDTCATIASAHNNMTLTTFYDINPTIDSTDCSNLLFGTNICLTKPAGPALNISPFSTHNSTSTNSTDTTTGGLAPGTAASCSKVYKAQTGDICSGIATKNNISVAWFEAQNPLINAACTNLEAGLLYCVQQEDGGSATSSAAAEKPSGTGTYLRMSK